VYGNFHSYTKTDTDLLFPIVYPPFRWIFFARSASIHSLNGARLFRGIMVSRVLCQPPGWQKIELEGQENIGVLEKMSQCHVFYHVVWSVQVSKDSEVRKKEKERCGQNERTPHLSVNNIKPLLTRREEPLQITGSRQCCMCFCISLVISLFVDCTTYTFRPSEVTLQLGVSLSDLD